MSDPSFDRPAVSVVVPFYNESENVSKLGVRIREVFATIPDVTYECLMVNDGSTDDTRERIDALASESPEFVAVHLVKNTGQSAALVAGMREARGDYIITLDGDLQNDPCDIPKIIELLGDYDCVCGYRANRKDSWVRLVSSRIANRVRGAILQDGIRDSGCGSKGFHAECVPYIVPFNGVHRFFAVLVRNAGFSIVECPVTHNPRVHGVSKYGVSNRLWRGIFDLVGVYWLRKRYVHPVVESDERQ